MRRRVTRKWYSHIFFTMEKIGMKNPKWMLSEIICIYFTSGIDNMWQHGIVKNDTFPETLDCVYVTRVICTYVIVSCNCHSWWWHKRTHACAHMDLEVHLEYTFLANNSQEAQYQCKLYDFLQSKSGKQLTSIKKVLLFVSYFRLTLNFILSFPQYVRLVMFSTWNCLATLRLVSENWQKKTLGHLLVKYTKLWINYCAHSINMTQRKFRQHNLMLKHS